VNAGRAVEVSTLLKHGARVDVLNEDGQAPLHVAALSGDVELADVLVTAGVDMELTTTDGSSALFLAIQSQHFNVAEYLIQKGANVTSANSSNITPLQAAIQLMPAARNIIKLLIEAHSDVHTVTATGTTLLHIAMLYCSDLDLISSLLQKGIDPNAVDADGAAALHIATETDWAEAVILLLQRGAHAALQDNKGQSPLHRAVASQKMNALRAFLDCCDPVIHNTLSVLPDKENLTPLSIAVRAGDIPTVQLLLRDNPNIADESGNTALHHAADCLSVPVISCLLTLPDININAQNAAGDTALHIAARHGSDRIASMLVGQQCEVDAVNNAGDTPLHCGIQHPAVLLLLAQSGANVEAVNSQGLDINTLATPSVASNVRDMFAVHQLQANPPSHKELLNALTTGATFLKHGRTGMYP